MYYVYRFLDKSKKIIYVGKSKQELEQRFKGHTHLPDECYSSVHKIEFISCSTETDMNIKEIYYINKYNNENGYFNLLDLSEIPKSVEFDDKWKMYRGALPAHFSKSINYRKGYSSKKETRYNSDGSEDKRLPNKVVGESSYVEPLSKEEVDLIVDYLIDKINSSKDNNKTSIWFRNLTMFTLAVNLPIKSEDFLSLKYKDLFDKNNKIKNFELKLGRYYKDEIIYIPLRTSVINILKVYRETFGLNYSKNAEDSLFKSREGNKNLTIQSWGRILKESASAVNIKKNIGGESPRKTYGLNIYKQTNNKLKAILFLGELWGRVREAQLIKYLNLTNQNINFDYFFGEKFSLADVDLTKIDFLNRRTIIPKKTVAQDKKVKTQFESSKKKKSKIENQELSINNTKKKSKPKIENKIKLEIVKEYLLGDITQKELSNKYDVSITTISRWVNDYLRYGEQVFK